MNGFTLNNLYNHGILDYVPQDLCISPRISALNGMQNPYLNAAKQGALYQQYANATDSVNFSNHNQNITIDPALTNSYNGNYGSAGIGSQSNISTANSFGFNNNIGSQSNTGYNSFGIGSIGSESSAGLNAFGLEGIGSQTQTGGVNAWGGFDDAHRNIKESTAQATSFWNSIPAPIKGMASAALIGTSLYMLCKRNKKIPVTTEKQSFWNKINPFNKSKKK